jgi:hypothetical protein
MHSRMCWCWMSRPTISTWSEAGLAAGAPRPLTRHPRVSGHACNVCGGAYSLTPPPPEPPGNRLALYPKRTLGSNPRHLATPASSPTRVASSPPPTCFPLSHPAPWCPERSLLWPTASNASLGRWCWFRTTNILSRASRTRWDAYSSIHATGPCLGPGRRAFGPSPKRKDSHLLPRPPIPHAVTIRCGWWRTMPCAERRPSTPSANNNLASSGRWTEPTGRARAPWVPGNGANPRAPHTSWGRRATWLSR